MTTPTEQHRDRPRLIKSIRKGLQRFQIAVYLIAILAMATFINFFMNMFGGSGSGGDLVSLNNTNNTKIEQAISTEDPEVETTPSAPAAVIEVLIDNETLLVLSFNAGKQKQIPISQEELIKLVKQAPGNSEGTKVRVSRKSSARKLTRTKLRKALDAAIGTEAQRWPEKLVD